MTRLNIIVEGQTEEAFVNEVLCPYLCDYDVYATARLVGRPGHKGGLLDYTKAKWDIMMYLKQDVEAFCTTMFDFYALPSTFPGMPVAPGPNTLEKVCHLENALYQDIATSVGDRYRYDRFIPYIQMHEFEALLFSDPEVFAKSIQVPYLHGDFREIRCAFPTPEDINNSRLTAPSKRILRLYPEYQKPLNGVQAAKAIGLSIMQEQCLHFRDWVTRLITLK